MVTVLHRIDHGPGAYRALKNVRERLSDPVIGNELVDFQVNHKRFQVPAILDGVLLIRGKFRPIDPTAVRTQFVLCTMCGNDDLEFGIMDLSPFNLDRLHILQVLSTSFTEGYRVILDLIGDSYPFQCLPFVPGLIATYFFIRAREVV